MLDTIKKYKIAIVLALIFFLALFLRLINLNSLPHSLQDDEVLTGYVGRFILSNGKDVYGNRWPLLYFNRFEDYYIIGPMYLKGAATFLFGVTAFAVRFPTALLGALTVIPVFLMGVLVFGNPLVGLFSAFALAVMPWHIVLSRASSEGIMGAMVCMTAVTFLLHGIQRKRFVFLIVASLLVLLGYFIYHPYRVYAPLLFLPLVFIYRHIWKDKRLLVYVLSNFIFFALLTFYIGTTTWGSGRFTQTSIFSPLSGVAIKNQELIYNEGQQKIGIARMFHNKVLGYGRELAVQYFSYLTPVFLFLRGGQPVTYNIPEQGLLYLSFFACIIFTFIRVGKTKPDENNFKYLIYLLLLAPFPAAMTVLETPNTHRSVFLSVILSVFIGYGIYKIFMVRIKKIPIFALLMMLVILEGAYFWHQYSIHFDSSASLVRNDGQRELIEYVLQHNTEYKKIYLPNGGTMPLYYLFYSKDFNSNYSTLIKKDIKIDNINNVYFIDQSCPSQVPGILNSTENFLVVNTHDCQYDPNKYQLLKNVGGVNPLLYFQVLKKR